MGHCYRVSLVFEIGGCIIGSLFQGSDGFRRACMGFTRLGFYWVDIGVEWYSCNTADQSQAEIVSSRALH